MTAGTLKVELNLATVWTDVTAYVRTESAARLTRGRQDEASTPAAATGTLTFDNRDGRFSPRNPSGAYYGKIGRNTPLRVSVLDDHAVYKVRFQGEVSEWPVGWNLRGTDVYVSVTASGPRRRLTAGAVPLQSPYKRAELALSAVVAYWPMEDGDDSTSFGSALPNGRPMFIGGAIDFASDSSFVAATALPTFGALGALTALVPAYTPGASGQQVRMLLKSNTTTGGQALNVYVRTSGAHYFLFSYFPVGGSATVQMFNTTTGIQEATLATFDARPWLTDGARLSIELKQNGTGIDLNLVMISPGTSIGASWGVVTIPSSTLGLITAVQVAPTGPDVVSIVGHITVENHITSIFDLAAVLDAYAGEEAAGRADRLAIEEGVPYGIAAGPVISELMGPQTEATFLTLFDESAYVDDGISTELVDDFGLFWRARTDMYSQTVRLALAYTDLQGLAPTDDDQALQNDVTVTRTGGSSARAVATGSLSPANVGTYAQGYDLSLFTDAQAQYQAGWRLGLGTVNAPRWPVVSFDAKKLTLAQRDALIALREGDLVTVSGCPAFTGTPGLNRVLVMGWTETITVNTWTFTLMTVPATAYDVIILNDATFGRLDSGSSTTAATMTTTATSMSVASTTALWGTTAVPFDVTVAGEQMTVTAVSGASSPQTFTVTRSVNGVVKTHAIGEAVSLTIPYRLGL